jgi:hypothetical protein
LYTLDSLEQSLWQLEFNESSESFSLLFAFEFSSTSNVLDKFDWEGLAICLDKFDWEKGWTAEERSLLLYEIKHLEIIRFIYLRKANFSNIFFGVIPF